MESYDAYLNRLAREHAAEVDADKLELTLWTLVRGTERAVARTRRHPKGIELIVWVGNELHSASAFTAAQMSDLERMGETARQRLVSTGWQELGLQA